MFWPLERGHIHDDIQILHKYANSSINLHFKDLETS